MNLLVLGPQGAGKGTQAKRIAVDYAIPHISTGDMFRAAIAAQTELGRKVEPILASGALVPDEITNAMVRDRLAQSDVAEGFLLDGYPRTVAQVAELDDILASNGQNLDAVVLLTADEDELVARLLKRAQIEGRADDTEDVIRHRLSVYREQTQDVVAAYRERGLVREVDGLGELEDVTSRILTALRQDA